MKREQPWFLRNSGFMEQIKPADREVFHAICKKHFFSRGEVIFRLGDPADSLHLIASGRVKLVCPSAIGRERILAICGRDDFMGEAFLRDADRYRSDAVAMSDVTTCPISRDEFRRLAREAPGFALTFAEVLASHLFRCHGQLSAASDPLKIRVAKILLEQAKRFGTQLNEDGWQLLETELRHDDIADLASASRVGVTLAIADLRNAGMLRGSRGYYELDVTGLGSLADEGG